MKRVIVLVIALLLSLVALVGCSDNLSAQELYERSAEALNRGDSEEFEYYHNRLMELLEGMSNQELYDRAMEERRGGNELGAHIYVQRLQQRYFDSWIEWYYCYVCSNERLCVPYKTDISVGHWCVEESDIAEYSTAEDTARDEWFAYFDEVQANDGWQELHMSTNSLVFNELVILMGQYVQHQNGARNMSADDIGRLYEIEADLDEMSAWFWIWVQEHFGYTTSTCIILSPYMCDSASLFIDTAERNLQGF